MPLEKKNLEPTADMVGRSAAVAICVAASMANESISLNMAAIVQALIARERVTVVLCDVNIKRCQLGQRTMGAVKVLYYTSLDSGKAVTEARRVVARR